MGGRQTVFSSVEGACSGILGAEGGQAASFSRFLGISVGVAPSQDLEGMARGEAQLLFVSLCFPLVVNGQNCTVPGALVGPCPQRPPTEREDTQGPALCRHGAACLRESQSDGRTNSSAMSFSRRKPVSPSSNQVFFPGAEPWRGIRSTCTQPAV